MHDFGSFAEKRELKKSTKVLVQAVQILDEEDLITIRVIGSHFLWHMVRRMVGLLVEVGSNRMTEGDIAGFLVTPSTVVHRYTAPAAGLFFERAFYAPGELNQFLGC